MVPAIEKAFEGDSVPINESQYSIGKARDLDELPYFNREGFPVKYDLFRLVSGGITNAFIFSFDKIREEVEAGNGNMERANILIITDAEDQIHMEKILEARNKIPKNVGIKINAITYFSNMEPQS